MRLGGAEAVSVETRTGGASTGFDGFLFGSLLDHGLAEAAREAASGFVASLSAALMLEGDARERALSVAGVELEMLLWLTSDARVPEASLVAGSRVDAFSLLAALGPDTLKDVLESAVDALETGTGIDAGVLEAFSMVTGSSVDPGDPVLAASAVIVSVAASFNKLLASPTV